MAAKGMLSRARKCFFDKNVVLLLQNRTATTLSSHTTRRQPTLRETTFRRPSQASKTLFSCHNRGPILTAHLSNSSVAARSYCSVSRACWNCSAPTAGWFFCESCHVVQPPDLQATLFDVMDCAKKFDLDNSRLSTKYKDLQRLLHPDRFSQHGEVEQDYASAQSAWVNKAYWTLQKPLSRGLYMLQLEGETIEEGDKQSDPELLMEVMEANERLGEAETEEQVRSIAEENREKLTRLCKELSQAFDEGDVAKAKDILTRMQYYSNIEDKVKERLPPS